MFEIIPSPGTGIKNEHELKEKIAAVRPFAKTIHIDVVDGIFAPNITFSDPTPFAKYTKDFLFEVHLMTDDPIKHLQKWADVGFQRFIGHVERMADQEEFVAQAQLLGEVVLALDKPSAVDAIKVPLEDLDGLLVMTIQAGLSGQAFEEALLEKVKQLRSKTDLPIEVDGGINDETIAIAQVAGANRFVATSFLYTSASPHKQFTLLHDKVHVLQEA